MSKENKATVYALDIYIYVVHLENKLKEHGIAPMFIQYK